MTICKVVTLIEEIHGENGARVKRLINPVARRQSGPVEIQGQSATMTRQRFMSALSAMLLAPELALAAAPTPEEESDPVVFVRRLYQRQILRDVRAAPVTDAELHDLFTREVRLMLETPIPPQPNAAIGRLVHVFYGPGVPSGWEVTLHDVAPAQGTSVTVDIRIRGTPRHIVVYTAREDGRWRIADIDYGEGESYVAYQRELRGQ